ncbi:MAG TPA: helix-turn-helix transcriptional regulator [Ktedonobacteraceae bacterium]
MEIDKDPSSSQVRLHHRPPHIERLIDRFLDAACDSSRRSILELLLPPPEQDSPDGYEFPAGEIARQLGLATSTTSEHLHHLLNLHLVSARKEGTKVYYRLCNYHLVRVFHELIQALTIHYHTDGSSSERSGAVEG